MFFIIFGTPNREKFRPEGKTRRWQAFGNQERHPDGLQDPFTQKGSPIFRHFEVPPGTPKSIKNWFVAKKSGSTEDSESIFVASDDFLIFSLFFSSIFLEKLIEKMTYFLSAALVFFNMATITKHCNLHIESYIFIFCVFAFLLKKLVKNRLKTWIPKKHRKMSPGGP